MINFRPFSYWGMSKLSQPYSTVLVLHKQSRITPEMLTCFTARAVLLEELRRSQVIPEVCLYATAEFSDADFAIICGCHRMKPGLAASVNGHIF